MTEQVLLIALLGFAFTLAPLMTNRFFLNNSRAYSILHAISLLALATTVVLDLKFLVVAWPLFCLFGFVLYVKVEFRSLLCVRGVATCIPYVFSLISSLWFVAGVLDLRLLGYDPIWSFYAALHGSFLGWLFVGCLAFLMKREPASNVYLYGCYVVFLFFLLIAFGIDGVPYLKPIGVVGLSFAAPLLIARYAFEFGKRNTTSLLFCLLSLASICLSMSLALLKEFGMAVPGFAFGFPVMVIVHGLLNALVVVPCFYLAIRFERAGISIQRINAGSRAFIRSDR